MAPALPRPTRASLKKERDAAIIKAKKSEKDVLEIQSIHSSHAKCNVGLNIRSNNNCNASCNNNNNNNKNSNCSRIIRIATMIL